jgi:integrase
MKKTEKTEKTEETEETDNSLTNARKAKVPPLTPTYDSSRKLWRLSVPPKYSPTGSRQRIFLSTKKKAELEAERLKSMQGKWGSEGRKVKASLAEDAAQAAKILEDYDISLTSLAKRFVAAEAARRCSKTFNELWAHFLLTREAKSDEHQNALDRIGKKILPDLGKIKIIELEAEQLEETLHKYFKSPHAFNLAYRSISPAFTLAVAKDWLQLNPFKRIQKIDTGRRGPVTLISLEQARKMLTSCRDYRNNESVKENWRVDASDSIPAVAMMLFAGIRPGEIQRLEWEDVDVDAGTIFISNQKAKTDRSRYIEMPDTLRAWITTYAPSKMNRTGFVTGSNWKRKIQIIRQQAGIATEGRDQLRKTFASMHLAAYEDVSKTRSILGHETSEVLFTNYRGAIAKKTALQFWEIYPTKSEISTQKLTGTS